MKFQVTVHRGGFIHRAYTRAFRTKPEALEYKKSITRTLSQSANPADRLKSNPDRLQDAVIIVRGKRVNGKAKYDSKAKRVRVFVPANSKLVNSAVTIESILKSKYDVSIQDAPPYAIEWAAEHVAQAVGYRRALDQLERINAKRTRAGKMPAYPSPGTRIYAEWLTRDRRRDRGI